MSFEIRYSAAAHDGLIRLHRFLLDRASTVEDFDLAERALNAISASIDSLSRSPFIFRQSPFLRELLIPFDYSGYVALFEIDNSSTVTVLALRHQREGGYHCVPDWRGRAVVGYRKDSPALIKPTWLATIAS